MPSAKSVVISCAGVGTRLGLATTKALVDIGGKTLIARQLDMLKEVEDIRIVIGYQAADVMDEVRKIRDDVIFCYNHEYFDTKTGASLFLGARHGNEYIIAVDGDLLVHPDDMSMLISTEGEWIAYSDITSEDTIFLSLNHTGEVTGFSRKKGDFEWTGPACIKKQRLVIEAPNVFNQLEPYLPMRGIKIRACDIDTYDDYKRALDFVETWGGGKKEKRLWICIWNISMEGYFNESRG